MRNIPRHPTGSYYLKTSSSWITTDSRMESRTSWFVVKVGTDYWTVEAHREGIALRPSGMKPYYCIRGVLQWKTNYDKNSTTFPACYAPGRIGRSRLFHGCPLIASGCFLTIFGGHRRTLRHFQNMHGLKK
jgi:hypothetical protein